jgi:hypothetical protein
LSFGIILNWSISLSLVAFNSEDKKTRMTSAILSTLSTIVLGCIIYLL